MQQIDVFTTYLALVAGCLALSLVWLVVARSFPALHAARFWFAGALAASIGSAISLGRGYLDPVLVILVGNGLMLLGSGLGWAGVRRFQGRPAPWVPVIAVTGAAVLALAVFTLWRDHMGQRIVIFAAAQSVLVGMAAIDLLSRKNHSSARSAGALMAAGGCLALVALNALRAVLAALTVGGDISFTTWNPLQAGMVFLLAVFGALVWQFGFLLMTMDHLRSEMAELAGADDLTGIANRRRFMQWGEQECLRSIRTERSFALMLIDIDRFKAINDSSGHVAGDAYLKLFAELATRCVRVQDLVARLGGDEFCVLLPETTAEDTLLIAGRLVEACRCERLTHKGATIGTTISVGVAAWTPATGRDLAGLVALADQALYRTKACGRDGVTLAGSDGPEARIATEPLAA